MRTFGLSFIAAILLYFQQNVYAQDSSNASENEGISPVPPQITVTSWNDMPFSGIVQENGTWIGQGYAFYIFDLISSKLNFTYTILPPEEHILGTENTGVLGLLYKKKVDVAVAFLPVLPEMRRYCSFSTALDETRLTALMKRPQESASGSGLLAPFDTTVWLFVFASVIFVGPVIYVFARIRSKLWNDPESENYKLPSCFWFVYSSLLKQGTNILATTDSTRMLFATWWIFILILTSFYTANLTAFLTKPQFTLSISSLEDIVNKGYSWVTYKGRTVDFLLSQNQLNELSLLRTSVQRGKGVFKYYEPSKTILESVSTRRLFLAEAHYLQTLIFEDYVNKTREQLDHGLRCTYVIMPGSILAANRAFGFPNGSAIENAVNSVLLRMVETGIIQHKKEEDLPLAEICPVDLRSSERQLRNTDLLLTYKVVVAGYGIAAIVFLVEIILALSLNRVRRKRDRSLAKENRFLDSGGKRMNVPVEMNPSDDMKDTLKQEKEHYINGRNYYVVIDGDGDQRLIPIRTPSAFLFQYTG